MIIFGTRGVKSTIKTGDFNCPQCNQIKPFRHRKVTKFFTLYFIPIIPLGNKGEYVECKGCNNTYIARVLENNTAENKEIFQVLHEKAIKHSMVLTMLADGEIDANEKQQVLEIINKFCQHKLDMHQLTSYIQEVQRDREDVSTYLKKIGSMLNFQGKELILRCAFLVAASDGNVDKSEIKLMKKMAKALDLTSSQYDALLAKYTSEIAKKPQTVISNTETPAPVVTEDHSRFMPN
ncbi:TerB family tellurite resistance protein [Tamlana sp. I1]|uniref:TerB family tellurite resistance protein n=1 Tax=Tamlana sp. I1 TaxID=2762061 RepID=UPI00188DFDC0|nr:TerB family tellurite resistance protein [Tamlana sp. I1]